VLAAQVNVPEFTVVTVPGLTVTVNGGVVILQLLNESRAITEAKNFKDLTNRMDTVLQKTKGRTPRGVDRKSNCKLEAWHKEEFVSLNFN
jgi:hypothetical protein